MKWLDDIRKAIRATRDDYYNQGDRISRLENRILTLENERNCAKGSHDWTLSGTVNNGIPYVACRHCYTVAKDTAS